MRIVSLFLVVYSMLPHKNTVSVRFYKTCSLKRFINCNSDNSVHTAIMIGNTCILWTKLFLNMFLP